MIVNSSNKLLLAGFGYAYSDVTLTIDTRLSKFRAKSKMTNKRLAS